MNATDAAYIAGLFDGEGSITYKKYKEKKKTGTYNCWRISMEISMTDYSVLVFVLDTLGVGTLRPKKRPKGVKKQWRWRCVFRDAYYVSLLLWPYAHIKLPKIQKIIEHYADKKVMNDNVVNLKEYKKAMSLE
tara:strand:- start:118 stop:516 length:399 start_codon:yes stop_codon:yes gene_type:complete